jgi:hypothetical protein
LKRFVALAGKEISARANHDQQFWQSQAEQPAQALKSTGRSGALLARMPKKRLHHASALRLREAA